MSEQINKVLASTSQAFSDAQKAQARANIGALAESAAGLSAVYTDSNLSGDGSSATPLGLNSACLWKTSTSGTRVGPGIIYMSSHNNTSIASVGYFEVANPIFSASSTWDGRHLQFMDGSGQQEQVDLSSIQKWNSMTPWAESGNSLGTGYGGARVYAASQYNYGNAYSNWACREVECDGVPNQQLYGFQAPPATASAKYLVNGNGHFVEHPSPYECHMFNVSGNDTIEDWLYPSAYPTGLPYDMRMDFVVYGTGGGAVVVNLDVAGSTADLRTGESATMFYDHTASSWHGQVGQHSM